MYQPTYTYDPTITTGPLVPVYTLRRLMTDTDFSATGVGVPRSLQTVLFSDQEYLAFLRDNNGDVTYAWSNVLLAIASNRATMAIYVSLGGGGDVDFRSLSQQLSSLSKEVLERYSSIPAEAYAEIDVDPFSAWRIAQNNILRSL